MTPDQIEKAARALETKITEQAKEYAADPQRGYVAGYSPKFEYDRSRQIQVGPGQMVRLNTDFDAWLQGICNRDLRGWPELTKRTSWYA